MTRPLGYPETRRPRFTDDDIAGCLAAEVSPFSRELLEDLRDARSDLKHLVECDEDQTIAAHIRCPTCQRIRRLFE